MSFRTTKCQMRKYTTGGRCSGDITCEVKSDTQGVTNAYAAMLEAREAQQKQWLTPNETKPNIEKNEIVVKEKPKPKDITMKKEYIDIILNGDID